MKRDDEDKRDHLEKKAQSLIGENGGLRFLKPELNSVRANAGVSEN